MRAALSFVHPHPLPRPRPRPRCTCPRAAAPFTPHTPKRPRPLSDDATPQVEVLRIRADPPVWTYCIIGVNVGVHAFGALQRALRMRGIALPSLLQLGSKVSARVLAGEHWRLLTAAFLHVNSAHLALNSYALFALGSATEILFGRAAFMTIYMLGALGGNTCSTIFAPRSPRPSIGSSSGVFALVSAMCIHLYKNRGPIGPLAQQNLRLVATATALNLLAGWLSPRTDGHSHFGGLLAGLLAAAALVPRIVIHWSEMRRVTFVEVRRAGVTRAAAAFVVGCAAAVVVLRAVAAVS